MTPLHSWVVHALTLFPAAAALNATAVADAATAANLTADAGQGKKGKKAGENANAKAQDAAAEQALQAGAQDGDDAGLASLLAKIPGAADLLSNLGLKRRNRQAFRRSINLQNYNAIAV
jgi:hypothetical protein